jgi:hypothetical protein
MCRNCIFCTVKWAGMIPLCYLEFSAAFFKTIPFPLAALLALPPFGTLIFDTEM